MSDFTLSCVSRLLIGLISRSGIRSIVVSPGSRSTPYLSAALELPELEKHLVVDERSAGYVALGLARAQHRPVALLCTSGTAAANYLPAVVEAYLSHVPLIVLTADRPLSLQECAAAQTIDQNRLFGHHVLKATSIVPPRLVEEDFLQLQRQILAILALAQASRRGPVHLNLHTPKPLELVRPEDPSQRRFHSFVESLIGRADSHHEQDLPRLHDRAIQRLVMAVDGERRGLITCGYDPEPFGLDPQVLSRFARTSGYPVLMDASHPLRLNAPAELRPYLVAPFEPLLRVREWWKTQSPSIVIQVGRPLTSARFERVLSAARPDSGIETILMLARDGWPDPSGQAEWLGNGDINDALARALLLLESSPPRSSGWSARWFRAAGVVEKCVTESIVDTATDAGDMDELAAVSALLEALPPGSRLVVGNSLAIRNVDFLATPRVTGIAIEALRGASGIDGVVSTAAGFALGGGCPTTLLVGDISFLHDIGGLWATLGVTAPLAIVVINNGGGRIFEQLPVANIMGPDDLAYWTTPHQIDLAAATRAYGLPYVRISRASDLADAVRLAHARSATSVIDVHISPHSARRGGDDLVASLGRRLVSVGLMSEPSST